ncbi:MAG: SH3 domain-containing protein [Ahrensia sp.]|nr:SH3 domain-containing protein [Ahrensia sp.]
MNKMIAGLLSLTVAISGLSFTPTIVQAQETSSINRGPSGLALPRFVSLKSARVNMRVGPGKDYAASWMYVKADLPLEILQEFDNWRRVRDVEGTIGWVHGALLSGTRTAITTPWLKDQKDLTVTMFKEPQSGAQAVAYLQPGVIATIKNCDGVWCEVTVENKGQKLLGYTNQADLWGAYPDEKIEN